MEPSVDRFEVHRLRAILLGTDFLGRDILSRLIYASRISMVVGFIPTAIVFFLGITVGMTAGFFGGWLDQLLMRFTDIIYAFPDFLFLIIIVASFRNSPFGKIMDGLLLIFVAIAIVGWVGVARLDARPGPFAQRTRVRRGGARGRGDAAPDHDASTCCRTRWRRSS